VGNAGRPRLTWRAFAEEAESIVVVGGTTQVFDLGTEGLSEDLTALGVFGDYTVRRTRFELGARVASTEANQFLVSLWYGCIVVGLDAFASGSGAVADPQDDNADWFVYGVLQVPTFPGATGQVTDAFRQVSVDSRLMRKVNENNQVIALVFSTTTGVSVQLNFAGRILVSHGRQ